MLTVAVKCDKDQITSDGDSDDEDKMRAYNDTMEIVDVGNNH